ncbi:hypothetical protein [Nitriliruptor alkaliphilus]|nr:hypothetical protein [Nitriliruptor alkaliphilus]
MAKLVVCTTGQMWSSPLFDFSLSVTIAPASPPVSIGRPLSG